MGLISSYTKLQIGGSAPQVFLHIFLIAWVEHQDERNEQKEKGNPGKKKSPQVPGAIVEVLKRFNSVIAINH